MSALDAAIAAAPVIAIVRHDDDDVAERIARAAIEGGAAIVEVTFTVPSAVELIARLRADHPACVVGAGTVLTTAQVRDAIDAGAQFLVSPIVDPEVVTAAIARRIPIVPGASTPSEVAQAARLGADAVKLFPAHVLGVPFLRAVREVLPGIRLMPTGGIDATTAGSWLDAGAAAVGIGGVLTSAWRRGGAEAVRAAVFETIAIAPTTRRNL